MAETTGPRFNQIKPSTILGSGEKGQSCDGTYTGGNVPVYLVSTNDGTTGDSGVPLNSLVNPLVIGYIINNGAVGADTPILIAPHSGTISKCKLVTKSSDGSTALTFTIKKNGTSVFTSSQTIAAGTAGGTLTTITALTSVPLSVSADDLFTIDISSGTSSWVFTVQLES